MKIGNFDFDINNKTYIMGILNVTPDSFSDGGSYKTLDDAYRRTEVMISEGAAIIDVGGESTRPGHTKIGAEAEIERVVPVIEGIKKRFDIPVSVDTYRAETAEASIKAGADLINDIWGFKYDKNMAEVAAKYNVACCLMHNKDNTDYADFLTDCLSELKECADIALKAGVSKDKIILDPGVGFGKTYEHNLICIKELEAFKKLGYPVLLGTSRKSVIGLTLNTDVKNRVEGTLVTTVQAVMTGCAFVRVHDIKENMRAIMMAEAIKNA